MGFNNLTKYLLTDDGYVNYADFINLTQPFILKGNVIEYNTENIKLLDHYVKREFSDKVAPESMDENGCPVYAYMSDLQVDPN